MKRLGVLLIAFGLGLAFILPWAQSNFFQDEFAQLELNGLRETGKAQAKFDASTEDNPLRIRLTAHYLFDGKLPPIEIPVFVKISDGQGTLLATIAKFPTREIGGNEETNPQRIANPIDVTLQNSGTHLLSLELAENKNDGGIKRPDIEKVTATLIRNAKPINDQYLTLGAVIAVLGFYLLIRSRRRNRHDNQKPRWGR